MKINSRNQVVSFFLLCFSLLLFFFITPAAVEKGGIEVSQDPLFMPNLITIILGVFSLIMLLSETLKKQSPSTSKTVPLFPRRVFIAAALFILYMILTTLIGYVPSTFLALAAYLFFFGVQKWSTIIGLSISFTALLYWFFAKVMLVMLPNGNIFGG